MEINNVKVLYTLNVIIGQLKSVKKKKNKNKIWTSILFFIW